MLLIFIGSAGFHVNAWQFESMAFGRTAEPESPEKPRPFFCTRMLNRNQMHWERSRKEIQGWLRHYPHGRVTLIFTGEGASSGALRVVSQEGSVWEMDPVMVSLGLCCVRVDLSCSSQVAWEWLGRTTFRSVFLRDCQSFVLPTHPHPMWADSLVSKWRNGRAAR